MADKNKELLKCYFCGKVVTINTVNWTALDNGWVICEECANVA